MLFIVEVGLFVYGETTGITVYRHEIPDTALARDLEGVTIVHISDLHIGKPGLIEDRLVKIINKIDPQIIFITGDFLSGNKGIGPCIDTLKRFTAGRVVIAILGNSDHSYLKQHVDTELLAKGLERAGVQLLRNESMIVRVKRDHPDSSRDVYIVGLDDNYLAYDDIFTAMNNVPSQSPKILLAHSANIIDKINTEGINLVLSGHTHGGQINLPLWGPLYLNPVWGAKRRMVAGLYQYETNVFINKGIGTTLLPLRLFCRPEVSILKFVKTPSTRLH